MGNLGMTMEARISFLAFEDSTGGNMIIGAGPVDYVTIGSNATAGPRLRPYQTKANPAAEGVWNCLSVH